MKLTFIRRVDGFVPGEFAVVGDTAGERYVLNGDAKRVRDVESAARRGAPERQVLDSPRLR